MGPRALGAIGLLAMGLAMAPARGSDDSGPLPVDAWNVIQQVERAAAATNWSQLRSSMADDFTWSFGGDGDADQAIAAWKEDPAAYLPKLRRVLTMACRRQGQFYDGQEHVFCPGKTDMDFRAGFTLGKDGWKMRYFVAGD